MQGEKIRVKTGVNEYSNGNKVICKSANPGVIDVLFSGSNNEITLNEGVSVKYVFAQFANDGGRIEIDACRGLTATILSSQNCKVKIGKGISTTSKVVIITAESTNVHIGSDCMIAEDVLIRTDDGHAIYDVNTGNRVNKSKDIHIGDHVWVGREALLLGGAIIGSGSVVGTRSIAKGKYPNNCVIAGSPARITRRDIAWERPHTIFNEPIGKLHLEKEKRSKFWEKTSEPEIRNPKVTVLKKFISNIRKALGK